MEPMSTIAGLKTATLIPSLAGGAVAGAIMRGPLHWRITGGIVGALFSIFLTDLAMLAFLKVVGAFDAALITNTAFVGAAERAAAFVMGLTGLIICQTILSSVERVKIRAPDLVDRHLDKR